MLTPRGFLYENSVPGLLLVVELLHGHILDAVEVAVLRVVGFAEEGHAVGHGLGDGWTDGAGRRDNAPVRVVVLAEQRVPCRVCRWAWGPSNAWRSH